MRRTVGFLLVLVCAALFAPTVSAHGAGSGTVSKSGSFVLTPDGTSNAPFHAYLSTRGLPIGPGDVLVWSWSANSATVRPSRSTFIPTSEAT